MIVFDVPFRKKVVRIDGADLEVVELVEGFWHARVPSVDAPDAGNSVTLSSGARELRDALTALYPISANEPIYLHLVPAQFANFGNDDETASLHNDLVGPDFV